MADLFKDKKPPVIDTKPKFKVAEVREDGTVIVENLDDGAMFPAVADESLKLRKGTKVEVAGDYNGKDGAVITSADNADG